MCVCVCVCVYAFSVLMESWLEEGCIYLIFPKNRNHYAQYDRIQVNVYSWYESRSRVNSRQESEIWSTLKITLSLILNWYLDFFFPIYSFQQFFSIFKVVNYICFILICFRIFFLNTIWFIPVKSNVVDKHLINNSDLFVKMEWKRSLAVYCKSTTQR